MSQILGCYNCFLHGLVCKPLEKMWNVHNSSKLVLRMDGSSKSVSAYLSCAVGNATPRPGNSVLVFLVLGETSVPFETAGSKDISKALPCYQVL
ncbi:hypothetical protein GOP47_0001666 [Adiantum capillus-veneris]|uniref:Uncharacterized protein n=1 Tax=Adiantum capillus-veneris TaxID=13818 RepID=A0A9D4ZNA3_ADICA|nr:hypothetical protein GOP47_0001666 [Adiantum capillus-veneris]